MRESYRTHSFYVIWKEVGHFHEDKKEDSALARRLADKSFTIYEIKFSIGQNYFQIKESVK